MGRSSTGRLIEVLAEPLLFWLNARAEPANTNAPPNVMAASRLPTRLKIPFIVSISFVCCEFMFVAIGIDHIAMTGSFPENYRFVMRADANRNWEEPLGQMLR